nr:hypothetical protein [Nakamurella lactea]
MTSKSGLGVSQVHSPGGCWPADAAGGPLVFCFGWLAGDDGSGVFGRDRAETFQDRRFVTAVEYRLRGDGQVDHDGHQMRVAFAGDRTDQQVGHDLVQGAGLAADPADRFRPLQQGRVHPHTLRQRQRRPEVRHPVLTRPHPDPAVLLRGSAPSDQAVRVNRVRGGVGGLLGLRLVPARHPRADPGVDEDRVGVREVRGAVRQDRALVLGHRTRPQLFERFGEPVPQGDRQADVPGRGDRGDPTGEPDLLGDAAAQLRRRNTGCGLFGALLFGERDLLRQLRRRQHRSGLLQRGDPIHPRRGIPGRRRGGQDIGERPHRSDHPIAQRPQQPPHLVLEPRTERQPDRRPRRRQRGQRRRPARIRIATPAVLHHTFDFISFTCTLQATTSAHGERRNRFTDGGFRAGIRRL